MSSSTLQRVGSSAMAVPLVARSQGPIEVKAGNEAFSGEDARAFEIKAQSLPNPSPPSDAIVGYIFKGPLWPCGEGREGSFKEDVDTLFPPSFDRRQDFGVAASLFSSGSHRRLAKFVYWKRISGRISDGMRIQSESSLSLSFLKESKWCSGEGTPLSRGEAALRNPHFEEDIEGFLGRVESDLRVHQSRIHLLVQKSKPPESSSIPSCGLALPLPNVVGTVFQNYVGIPVRDEEEKTVCFINQMSESFTPSNLNPACLRRFSNLVTGGRTDAPQVVKTCWHWFGGLGSVSFSMKIIIGTPGETKNEKCDRRLWVVSRRSEIRIGMLFRRAGLQLFPQGLQEALPRRTSDHWPIVLDTNPFKWGPTPFRFENMWLQHPSFKENFRNWWRGFQGNGWEGEIGNLSRCWRMKGLVLNNAESITEEILLYFEKLYASPTGESWSVEGLDWDKAPGPDGFTIAVFQDCWDVIKEDLVRVFAEFHRSGIINQSTNASIVLRLRGVLHETITLLKALLFKGDKFGCSIANEIVDERRRSGEEGVVFKIDFEKAYDHVILVNGNAKGWVKASRGLRQGPLSPFLFTLVADVLSRMLLRAEERNLLEGFRNHLSRLAKLLDCKASVGLYSIWLPLGGNPKACGFWDPVIERISRRLDGWQKTYLSFEEG
ncbi:hypothetical protein CK203_083666 [Vitis vinifera]|uniref:Reverse transcriptase domain-containing protein n=1 Tax=Vitis vinifera TaxID=29760 RepID=A0A438CYE7_VITVI|nr:hypothetical protein CK203_083666 [Vitis vinifera]